MIKKGGLTTSAPYSIILLEREEKKMTKKEKATLHAELIELLTKGGTDSDFYDRMIYALQIIAKELEYFNEEG